jgi:DNA-binding transcriptional LysR family regulator
VTTKDFFYKSNRLQQLRGFCLAAQLGSISGAAAILRLSHAAVSIQIKSLERDLGVKLFQRAGPRIRLTLEGNKLLELSAPLVEGIDGIELSFRHELETRRQTEVTIAANSTSLNFILPRLVKHYLAHNPDIYLNIHYAEQRECIDKLRKRAVDIALLPRREHAPFPDDTTFECRFTYKPALITRKDHPLAGKRNLKIEAISKYELSLPDKELRVIPNLYDIFPQNRIDKRLRITFTDWETTRKFIEAGLVISISSDVIIEKRDSLVATPLTHLFKPVEYGFLFLKRRTLPHQVLQFMEAAL